MLPGPGEPDRRSDEEGEQCGNTERPPGQLRKEPSLRDEIDHGKPPSRKCPGGPLAHCRRPPEEVIDIGGHPLVGEVDQRLRELVLEPIDRLHADIPSRSSDSASPRPPATDARSAATDRWSRDFAVPTGMPSTPATCGRDMPA